MVHKKKRNCFLVGCETSHAPSAYVTCHQHEIGMRQSGLWTGALELLSTAAQGRGRYAVWGRASSSNKTTRPDNLPRRFLRKASLSSFVSASQQFTLVAVVCQRVTGRSFRKKMYKDRSFGVHEKRIIISVLYVVVTSRFLSVEDGMRSLIQATSFGR